MRKLRGAFELIIASFKFSNSEAVFSFSKAKCFWLAAARKTRPSNNVQRCGRAASKASLLATS